MTTLVVLQPGYLPWLGFFDQMIKADVFVYYDDVQFDKHGWRNRNRVKGLKGPIWLTVPVHHKGRTGQPINSVEIVHDQPWSIKHLRTIREIYAKAPHIKDYIEDLTEILTPSKASLADLCYETANFFRGALGIQTPLYWASKLGIRGEQSTRLVNICKHFQVDTYLSGESAKSYLQTELFATEGIEVQWHNYHHPIYKQQHGPFISHLSIIDLLMNMGPESRSILLDERHADNI